MPIPFRDSYDVDELGAAAFFKIERPSRGSVHFGALFLINARGEPLEFAYNRIEIPQNFLWRQADLRRQAERKLATSLLGVCAHVPMLLLCQADEVGSELFCEDIQVSVPVGRIGDPLRPSAYSGRESQETVAAGQRAHLFWFPGPPGDGSAERQLLDRLVVQGLLLEPFERAAIGLKEVFATDTTGGQ